DYMSRDALVALNLPWSALGELSPLMKSMYRIMLDYDAELVEFNPLAYTCEGKLVALDAKIIIDDNSLYKHPELQRLHGRDLSDYEKKAKDLGFSYVELDGDIGVISNGAGLTMATMDSILYYGGKPANFLDIGGGASRDRVKEAVKLMLTHPRSKVLLINIFGGITRCDEVAAGIVEALREVGVSKPIVVRMLGTNEEEGRRILREHGIDAYFEMDDAVKAVVERSRR
ncbi:MAG: succinate--CoA ligase subunit beta, partial [Desulfurococcaceae archaeon]